MKQDKCTQMEKKKLPHIYNGVCMASQMILCCKLEIENTLLMFQLNISLVIGVNCKAFSQKCGPVFWFQDSNTEPFKAGASREATESMRKFKSQTFDIRSFSWLCTGRWLLSTALTSWNFPYTSTFHSCQWRMLLLQHFLVTGDVEPSIYTCIVLAIVLHTCT